VDERIDLATPLRLNIFPAAETHGDGLDRGGVAMGMEDLIGAASASMAKFLCCVITYDLGRRSRASGATANRISFGRGACRNKGDLAVMPVGIELLEGLQRTDGAEEGDGTRPIGAELELDWEVGMRPKYFEVKYRVQRM